MPVTHNPQFTGVNNPAYQGSKTAWNANHKGALDVFNVKTDYSATGDGLTDDTATVQAAITAAISAGGGIVYFPFGTYIISASLTVTSDNVQLIGAGWGAIIKAKSTFTASTPMVWVKGPGGANFRYGVKVADLYLDGNTVTGIIGLELDSTYHAQVNHIRIKNCIGRGIYCSTESVAFGAYTHISDSAITDGGSGVGVETNNHEYVTVSNCLIAWYNGSGAFGALLRTGANQILNTSFDECDTAIDVYFTADNHIIGCNFDRGITRFLLLQGARTARVVGCTFGAFLGTGSKNIIDVADAQNAGNMIVANTANAASSGWAKFVVEAGGTGGTPPNQYTSNQVQALTSTMVTGSMSGINATGGLELSSAASRVRIMSLFASGLEVFNPANTVNWLEVNGGATGQSPIVYAIGETNLDIGFVPKGIGGLKVRGGTGGLGYGTGTGGAITQQTSSATAVTLDKPTGQITTFALTTAVGAEERFTVNCASVAATDCIALGTTYNGAGTPAVSVLKVAASAFDIVITNLHAANALNAAMVINFAVIKAVAS